MTGNKNEPGEFCRVHFRVKCNTDVGQVVAVSGNCYALGNSKKEDVVHLVTTPESHPIWYTASPLVIPRGDAIHYRFCLVEGGTVKAFENADFTRSITLNDIDTTIEDEFQLGKLDGFGQDPEKELFEQMRQLTRKYSEADKMVYLNAAQRNSRLFLVCYHLPIVVRRTGNEEAPFEVIWNESILARSQSSSIAESMGTTWVGTLSVSLNSLTDKEKAQLEAQLHSMSIVPVFIDDEIAASAYYGFCKQIMWPVFHNVDQLDQIHSAWNLQDDFRQNRPLPANSLPQMGGDRSRAGSNTALMSLGIGAASNRSRSNSVNPNSAENNRVLEWNALEEEFHLAHEAVNNIFARTLLGLVRNEDVVWVHDYHLMGLPKLLRAKDQKTHTSTSTSTASTTAAASAAATATSSSASAATSASKKIAAAAEAPPEVSPDLKDLRIIFFMHIPFPTSQLFRTLPRASDLLESMICADVVGFHAFDHARHFLNAAKRMLGIRSGSRPGGMITLSVADREVLVTVSHCSIETERIGPLAIHPETLRIARELRQRYHNKRIIVGVDVCQRLSGVALKFAAFDKMLSDSSWGRRGNVVLIQKCLRNNTRPGDEETTSNDLRKMVADINGKYAHHGHHERQGSNGSRSHPDADVSHTPTDVGSLFSSRSSNLDGLNSPLNGNGHNDLLSPGAYRNQVIDYEERDKSNELAEHERLALWLVADVFLLTPIREGLNLMPLEYIYARRELPNAGAVVVSEFSTCSALLNGSLKVNPFAPLRVADALEKALMLSSRDKELRRQRDLPFISSHPSALWTRNIVNDLEQLQSHCGRGRTGVMQGPVMLQEDEVLKCYNESALNAGICQAGSRVFIFDYGGTLLHKEKYDIYIKRQTLSAIAGRKPSEEIMRAIERLSNDPHNVVVVITGLTKQKLGDTFAGLRNVTLATSNGLVYSWGQNLLPAPHHKRTRLHSLAVAAATAAANKAQNQGSQADFAASSAQLLAEAAAGASTPITGVRELGLGQEVTRDLIALSLADSEREWGYNQDSSIDWQAVSNVALPIISKFTYRTNGTCQSPRIPGIGWSYFGADPEEGYRQAKQLTIELEAALACFDVKVTSLIQSSLEVVPRNLHKGLLIKPLLEKVMSRRGGRLPGFLLVCGDDPSDDKMVETVYEVLGAAAPSAGLNACRTFSTCVGKRNCPAQYYLNDVEDVKSLLTALSEASTTATLSIPCAPSVGSTAPATPGCVSPVAGRARGVSEATLVDVVGLHL